MIDTDIFIVAVGVILFALVSGQADNRSITGPIVFTGFGLLIGAAGLDLVNLSIKNEAINILAEVTLVVTLFCDASRINVTALTKEHRIPIRLLTIGLPLCMFAGALVAWGLFPALGFGASLLLGIALAPTDAALGQAVVSNQAVPQRVRQALNVESGLNDGLAYPALLIVASFVLGSEEIKGAAEWLIFVAEQVILGPLVGGLIGLAGAIAAEKAKENKWMDEAFSQIIVLGLALAAYAGAGAVGGNGFLAAFTAGLMVATRAKHIVKEAARFGEAEGQLLSLVVFLLFGAILLPDAFTSGILNWRIWLYAVLSLTVLRMLPVAISLIGAGLRPATIIFIGWFGPRGLASILYVLLLLEQSDIGIANVVVQIVFASVILSVFAHGLTAMPFSRYYADILNAKTGASENVRVKAFPTRHNS